jgi:uncharacterized SAM-binding protein YcdF (DUF218 family)
MKRNLWRGLWRAAVHGCALIGLIFLLATFTPLVRWYATRLAGPWNDPRGETLIVLAGSSLNGFPSENTLLRCMYAVFAYREGGVKKIVVTGRGTSRHMRSVLIAEGVPAEIVVVEDSATSTHENALRVKALIAGDPGSKVLITSDYHMYRAIRAFRKAGLQVAPRPIPDALKRFGVPLKRWESFLTEAAETAGIAYYAWRDWI